MKDRSRSVAGPASVFASAALVLIGCAPAAPTFSDAHRAALADSLESYLEQYVADVNTGDLERIVSHYAEHPDFRFLESGQVAYTSHEAVSQALLSMEGWIAELRLTVEEPAVIALAPGVGTVNASYHQVFVSTDGEEFDVSGVFSFVGIHTPGGWKWLTGHTSQPVPRGDSDGEDAEEGS